MAAAKGKTDAAQRVIDAVRKGFGAEAAQRLSEDGARSVVCEAIPTGIAVLDHYILGCGGLPVGRMVEAYSEEGVGKTSLAMGCVAGAQRAGGVAIWLETEQGLDRDRFATFGADVDQVILLQPGSIEVAGQQVEAALRAIPKSCGPNIVVWDSIAATPTQAEVDEGLQGKDAIGVRARALGKICKLLATLAIEKRCALLLINQVREKIGVMFGDRYTTPGGHAVKFHASVRLQMFGGKSIKVGSEHVGKIVTVLAAKNRMTPPWRKAQVRLDYMTGWNNAWTILNHAKDRKLVPAAARGRAALDEAIAKLGWGVEADGDPDIASPAPADDGEEAEAAE